MKKLTIPYFQTETFGAVDGPGVRYVVFVQGCYYRCLFCHNPESWDLNRKVKRFTADEIIEKYKHNIEFYKNGGITISGGDPTVYLDFLIELARKCYEQDISLAIDTSGVNFTKSTESKHKRTNNDNPPKNGTKAINIYSPFLPTSCNLLAVAERTGRTIQRK